jgi:hypothetical protein
MQVLLNRLSGFRYQRNGATWRSGYATVCKTVYPGSIPGVASKSIQHPKIVDRPRARSRHVMRRPAA